MRGTWSSYSYLIGLVMGAGSVGIFFLAFYLSTRRPRRFRTGSGIWIAPEYASSVSVRMVGGGGARENLIQDP